MPLGEYRRKRDFKMTSEPRGGKAARKGWKFVVQKHDASHLHYDFRLEWDGVLKSWAVPKGPSLDPSVRRLAVAVEDHPLEYGDFEGVIPEGQYGGGTVMLWDKGTWEPVGDAKEGLESGKLKFRLRGHKLSGAWMLVRSGGRGRDPRQWLLFKERDEFAKPEGEYDVLEKEPLSVKTGRDLDEIAAAKARVWDTSGRKKAKAATKGKPPARKRVKRGSKLKKKLPVIKPQLATLVTKAPDGDQWLHEIKFDGYRILTYIDEGQVHLTTRNALDWTSKLSELRSAAEKLSIEQAILDGELVTLDKHGRSDFQSLQTAIHENRTGTTVYYAFDLLWLDGQDLRGLPLEKRKKMLARLRLSVDRGPLRMAEHVEGSGGHFFEEAQRLGLEGIISKRVDRPYIGGRTTDWVKVKCGASGEFVIGGFTDPAGARNEFGALLLGYHEKPGELVYAGRVGTGFDEKLLASLGKQLRARETKSSPFAGAEIKRERHAHWVRPNLVAQIRFSNWTRDGLLRQPVFLGLREDKPAEKVGREVAQPITKVKRASDGNGRAAPAGSSGKSMKHADETVIEGARVTHPDKVLYPDDGITKRDLADYYLSIAEWMLPHVAERPLSIVRFPEGLSGGRFFQKHPNPGTLNGLARVKIKESDGTAEYVVIRKPSDLAELVQISALELHVWGAKRDDVERPDRLVFDLDPDVGLDWSRVVTAARQIRDFLSDLGLVSFVKTSGGKGLHLVVPIARRHEWPFVSDFCRAVAMAIARAAPNDFVATMSKTARRGKIFVDYLRNQRGATSVATLSTRAQSGAPVSMALAWEELGSVKSADQYDVKNARRRLTSLKRDPWAEMDKVRQSLTARMLRQLEP
jgi:bifunctional non-homologous end joining protein LigD